MRNETQGEKNWKLWFREQMSDLEVQVYEKFKESSWIGGQRNEAIIGHKIHIYLVIIHYLYRERKDNFWQK